jgi:hypothetical protein
MLGHAGAIVVFDFVIDGHGNSLVNAPDESLGNCGVAGIGRSRLCAGSKWRYLLAMKIERRQMRKALRTCR